MIPIPAIDLRGGRVVRLERGDFHSEKVYSDDPVKVAEQFREAGAKRLHVVDLDGALGGRPVNAEWISRIVQSVHLPAQAGGGIRDLKTAERYLGAGVSWVILGTQACLDRGFLREALAAFGSKVIVGVDAKDGWVAVDGWTRVTDTRAAEFAESAERLGTSAFVYTDITRDGALEGPNVSAIEAFCRGVEGGVIASGGVASLEDLRRLAVIPVKNLTAVIVGKALYEKKFTLREASQSCLPNESFPV